MAYPCMDISALNQFIISTVVIERLRESSEVPRNSGSVPDLCFMNHPPRHILVHRRLRCDIAAAPCTHKGISSQTVSNTDQAFDHSKPQCQNTYFRMVDVGDVVSSVIIIGVIYLFVRFVMRRGESLGVTLYRPSHHSSCSGMGGDSYSCKSDQRRLI